MKGKRHHHQPPHPDKNKRGKVMVTPASFVTSICNEPSISACASQSGHAIIEWLFCRSLLFSFHFVDCAQFIIVSILFLFIMNVSMFSKCYLKRPLLSREIYDRILRLDLCLTFTVARGRRNLFRLVAGVFLSDKLRFEQHRNFEVFFF